MDTNKRLDDVAFLRSIAIVSVVLYHSFCIYLGWGYVDSPLNGIYDSIFNFWLAARLPLFIFISGYLFSHLLNERAKYQSVWGFIQNKTHRLIIPYFIFSIAIMLTYRDFSWKLLLHGNNHMWFILMLFWSFVFTRFLKPIKSTALLLSILFVSIIVSVYVEMQPFFSINWFIKFYCWFLMGYVVLLNRDKLKWLTQVNYLLIPTAVWLLCNIVLEWYCPGNRYAIGLIKSLSIISIILSCYGFVNYLLSTDKIKISKPIEALNRYSYGIYIFHHWIILYFFVDGTILSKWPYELAAAYPIVFPLCLFVFSLGCSILLTKYFLKTKLGRYLIA